MNRYFSIGLLGAALAAAALPVLAQPAPAPRGPAGGLFRQADADHNGRVTEAEAMDFLAARFATADADHDGGVSRQELSDYLRAQHQARGNAATPKPSPVANRPMPRPAAALFRAADANNDGKVTMDELRPVAAALFRATDVNGDGALEAGELHHGPRPGGPGRERGRGGPAQAPAPSAPAPTPAP
jgi:hypothetical protein